MNLITIKDELYEVIRTIPEHTGIDTEKFRILTHSTNVFRKDGWFWFVFPNLLNHPPRNRHALFIGLSFPFYVFSVWNLCCNTYALIRGFHI